jgi:ABC-type nitrate/sulfonate/bicarbonate transport system substrate-binding protein
VPRFITHVIFARTQLIDEKPALVGRFVKGFFATLDWMRQHKAQTIADADAVLQEGSVVLTGAYEREMPVMSRDGQFDPVALKAIKESWVALKTLPTVPSDDEILTRKFIPVKLETTVGSK